MTNETKLQTFFRDFKVFLIIIAVIIPLLIYRRATYATYTTISENKLTDMVKSKKNFVLVAGKTSEMTSFSKTLTKYCTKHRNRRLYYINKGSSYIRKKFKVATATPCTLVFRKGKVTAHRSGALQFYYFNDFVETHLKDK